MIKIIFKKQAKVNGKWFAANTQIQVDEKQLESLKKVGALEVKEGLVAVGENGVSTPLPTEAKEEPKKPVPAPEPEDLNKLTKPEIVKKLTDLDVEFDSKANRETLLGLLKESLK